MKRISTNQSNFDTQYYMRLREWQLNQLNNKMSSQKRIQNLRDDPLAAAKSTRYKSEITRMKRYSKNVENMKGNLSIEEGYLRDGLNVLQRVRELAVQGANGVLDKSQMAYLGQEVNELLKEFVAIANSKKADGEMLFSGFKNSTTPFRINTGNVPGAKGEVITSVDYIGDIGKNAGEISEAAYTSANIPGNYAFWAENQQIYSNIDARNYRAQVNSEIRIDGVTININEGDNVYAIISKINDSSAPVKARMDPIKNSIALQTTFPHQMWLEDGGNGTVLQDLGIVSSVSKNPPLNNDKTSRVFGGSIFDMMINLRDSLFKGNAEAVGSSGLAGIDKAINSLTSTIAEVGAKDARLEVTLKRLNTIIPDFVKMDSNETDLDLSKAVTDLKMLEYTHQAALSTASRVLRPTLLDFLR
ncbi:MAG: flagellar hook-associated protein 3 [Spirochaetales bacterium]|nr:flagellar hook-associated protein 3 [Spirochaetales bacterium]